MIADLREQFLLDRDWHFLNHGSFGACPRPVFAEYQRWQRELETQPVHFMLRRLPDLLQNARERLATFINAEPDNLIFATNATSALNLVIRSLDWQPGDEILSSDQEYGALQRTWEFVSQRSGAQFRALAIPTDFADENDFVKRVWREVTPQTRAIFLSHITSPTALLFPLQTLIQRARAANILTIIDGAHAPGQIPLDMSALGADAYAGNCHKWLCAPKGSAFLYVNPSLHEHMVPLVISHGWLNGASFTSRNDGTARKISPLISACRPLSIFELRTIGKMCARHPSNEQKRRELISRRSAMRHWGHRIEIWICRCSPVICQLAILPVSTNVSGKNIVSKCRS